MKNFLCSLAIVLCSIVPAFGQAISSSGTISSNQLAVFSDNKHVVGSTNMTYDTQNGILRLIEFRAFSGTISNISGPAFVGSSSSSGLLEGGSLGPGLKFLFGPFRIDADWAGFSPTTNNNPGMALKGLVMTGAEQRSMSYSNGVNFSIDWNGSPVQYFNQTGNSTITFANTPTMTNSVPHVTLIITNTGAFTNTWPDTTASFQWITGNTPTMLPNRVHRFDFYWIKDQIWGEFSGPATPIIPAVDSVIGPVALDTASNPMWIDGSQGFIWSQEYVQNEALNNGPNYIFAGTGTGAIGNGSSATNLYGAVELQAPASGDASTARTSTTYFMGDGDTWYEARLAVERIPTGAQDSRIMAGIVTYKAAGWFGTTNGCWWQLSSTNADLRMMTATNGVVTNTGSGTNAVINTVYWVGIKTSGMSANSSFYIGPTKQIMRTNLVGTVAGTGKGNLAFGHAVGVQVTKTAGSGTDNRVLLYHHALSQRPSTPY